MLLKRLIQNSARHAQVLMNSPDSSLHQNHEKNTPQAHVGEQHGPLECPTMGDQGRFAEGPAGIYEEGSSQIA